jgi:hypothetical protein
MNLSNAPSSQFAENLGNCSSCFSAFSQFLEISRFLLNIDLTANLTALACAAHECKTTFLTACSARQNRFPEPLSILAASVWI